MMFRWVKDELVITDDTYEHHLSGNELHDLLATLYKHREEVKTALVETHQDMSDLPEWMRSSSASSDTMQQDQVAGPPFMQSGNEYEEGDSSNILHLQE